MKSKKTNRIKKGRRFPVGLQIAARRLNVSMSHLYRVLVGERISAKTTKGYEALVAELQQTQP